MRARKLLVKLAEPGKAQMILLAALLAAAIIKPTARGEDAPIT